MLSKKLDGIERKIKKEIIDSIKNNTSFKNIVLSTVSNNKPSQRIVVLREFSNDWNVYFYSDSRSRKIQEIKRNKTVSILLYNSEKKNQIRIYGTSNICEERRMKWEQMSIYSKKNYNTVLKPGEFQKNHLTKYNKKHELGYKNFCIIKVQVNELDCLYLSKRVDKRVKIKILREGKNIIFKKEWIVP